MKKVIRKLGVSAGIIFNKEERRIENIEVGDIIDIIEFKLIKQKREVKNKNDKST